MARINQKVQTSVGAAGAATSVNLGAPGANNRWRVQKVIVSLSVAPAGAVTVTLSDGTTSLTYDLIGAGTSFIDFGETGLQMAAGGTATLTVAAPGGAVVARANLVGFMEQ